MTSRSEVETDNQSNDGFDPSPIEGLLNDISVRSEQNVQGNNFEEFYASDNKAKYEVDNENDESVE